MSYNYKAVIGFGRTPLFKKYRSQDRINANISMTPMIDVVFILLSFFMLTSTYIQTSSLNVDLPKAQTSDAALQQNNILVIFKEGAMQWNGEPVTLAQLPQIFRQLKTDKPGAALVIQGDQDVPYNLVIQAMDQARIAGIERLSLATVVKN